MKLFELFATIKLDDKEFTDNVKKATEAGGKLGKNVEGVSAKAVALGNAMYDAGVKIAGTFVSFTKSSVEAAAQIEAERAQFTAAFGDMADTANASMKRVQEGTGILSSRLAPISTKVFAQFKGSGMDAAEAMQNMEKYLLLAADAAAMYDISVEDADSRIRSFLRGNVEAGDAIGLQATEMTRNEKALELYGKKWLELTEAQRQYTLLDIGRGLYDLSGATGQALREADSWQNVVGNLERTWVEASASFGTPLVDAFTPAVQKLGELLSSEEFTSKISNVGTLLANAFTSLVDGEDSPLSNVLSFVNDITNAISGEGPGQSLVKAVGIAAGVIFAITNPVAAVVAAVTLLITKWETVKKLVSESVEQMLRAFGLSEKEESPSQKGYSDYQEMSGEERAAAIASGKITQAAAEQYDLMAQHGYTHIFAGMPVMNPKGTTNAGEWRDPMTGMTQSEIEELVSGSHAKGLSYVPYDNYRALLHRGEEVLTAAQAEKRRSGESMDLSGMYEVVAAAVRAGVSSIAVNLDGRRVGEIISRHQAAQTENELMSRGYVMA